MEESDEVESDSEVELSLELDSGSEDSTAEELSSGSPSARMVTRGDVPWFNLAERGRLE